MRHSLLKRSVVLGIGSRPMPNFTRFRLRDFTPKGLYPRSLLIVVMPLLMFLIATVYIFHDSHLRHASRKLSQATASAIADKVEALEAANPTQQEDIMRGSAHWLKLNMKWAANTPLPAQAYSRWNATNDEILQHELAAHLDYPFWFDTSDGEYVFVKIRVGGRVLNIRAERDRVFFTRGSAFIFWMAIAVIVIIGSALGFLRNHVKSVLRLSEVAQALGKGRPIGTYRPFGATEVRLAARAILDMHKRIMTFHKQRTDMLAGVSHDLRTPLTRIRLVMATQPDEALKDSVDQDLLEMSKMLDAYLDFARDAQSEQKKLVNLGDILAEVSSRYGVHAPTNENDETMMIAAQPLNIRRAINNVVENALNHAQQVEVSIKNGPKTFKIRIDDDGPGIAKEDYEAAFQPFNRLDPARNQNATGTGLGLTIARDIMREHGGKITLSKSRLGGLRATLVLPK